MNITISSLFLSSTLLSPVLSHTYKEQFTQLNFNNIYAKFFFNHFLYSQANFLNAAITHSNFNFFLDSTFSFEGNRRFISQVEPYSKGKMFSAQQNVNIRSVTFQDCIFLNCNAANGAAVYLYLFRADLSFIQCSFQECASNRGGCVYAYHQNATFTSRYCCFTECTASTGMVLYGDLASTNSNFSTEYNCSLLSTSEGDAQYFIRCYDSTICQYFNTTLSIMKESSSFSFERLYNHKITFLNIVHHIVDQHMMDLYGYNSRILLSYCNLVNITTGSLIFFTDGTATAAIIDNCFFKQITFTEYARLCSSNSVTLRNCVMDSTINIQQSNTRFSGTSINCVLNPYATTYDLLFKSCGPAYYTSFFTPSNTFSFSETFTPSIPFTKSSSKKFTSSSKFTSSNEFSSSSTFTASNTFTPSDVFTPSLLLNYDDEITKEKGIYETYSSSLTVSYILSVSYSSTQRITYFYSNTMINGQLTNALFSTIEYINNQVLVQRLITAYVAVEYDRDMRKLKPLSASLFIGIVFGVGGLFLIISILSIFIIKRKREYHHLVKPKSKQDYDDLYTSSDFRSDEAYEREMETNRGKSENVRNNPLFNEHSIDDPFANDFDNQD